MTSSLAALDYLKTNFKNVLSNYSLNRNADILLLALITNSLLYLFSTKNRAYLILRAVIMKLLIKIGFLRFLVLKIMTDGPLTNSKYVPK